MESLDCHWFHNYHNPHIPKTIITIVLLILFVHRHVECNTNPGWVVVAATDVCETCPEHHFVLQRGGEWAQVRRSLGLHGNRSGN